MAESLAAGHASFWLEGQKLRGGWSLQHTDGRRWLLVKRRDEHADTGDPVSTRPESVVSGRTIEGKQLRAPKGGEMPPEEIAARTVNKERARSGEARTRSR
jgi:hypothetical protein